MKDQYANLRQKEKRELFCKTVNSIIMRTNEGQLPNTDLIINEAKKVVDKAFEFYPNLQDTENEEFDFPTK